VSLGDAIEPGQVIARLDPADEENGLRGAEAAQIAAAAQLSDARSNYNRQRQLFERDFVSFAGLERAEQVLTSAQSAFDAADAQVGIARRRLADTVIEAGEVVTAGRRIVQIAGDEGKDAVFDVPAAIIASTPVDPEIAVTLSLNPGVSALGRVREVAPRADSATGTIRVRIGLIELMRWMPPRNGISYAMMVA
jgi:RND family efflux transporter MFP subunit